MTPVMDARRSLRQLECALALNDVGNLSEDACKTVQAYNREDCISTLELRNWLENIRHDLIARGNIISRPVVESDKAPEPIDEQRARVRELMNTLLSKVSDDPTARNSAHTARW